MTDEKSNILEKTNEETGFKNILILGDVQVGSSEKNLNNLVKIAEKCLKNRKINRYLSLDLPKKKMLGI